MIDGFCRANCHYKNHELSPDKGEIYKTIYPALEAANELIARL
jgi:hypothetical protein